MLTLTYNKRFFNFCVKINGLRMNLIWNTVSVVSQPRSIFSAPLISPNVSISGTLFFDVDGELGCWGTASTTGDNFESICVTSSWSAEIWRGFKCVSHRRTWIFSVIGSNVQIKYRYGTSLFAGIKTSCDHTFESIMQTNDKNSLNEKSKQLF